MSSLYLTAAEFRATSSGQDTNNLVPGGDQAAQDAELVRKIRAAGGWIDGRCSTSLIAQRTTELLSVPARADGLSIHPRRSPLNELLEVRVGWRADALAQVSVAGAWIEEQQFRVPAITAAVSGARPRLLARLDYVAGFPNTVLATDCAAGAGTLTVADPVGFTPDLGSIVHEQDVRIIDGGTTETVTVTSVAGNVLTLAAPTSSAHSAGAVVSQLPPDVKEAAAMAIAAHLRARSSDALVMSQTITPGAAPSSDSYRWKLLRDADTLLEPFKRIR